MNFWHSVKGSVEIELTSAAPEDTILAITELGIHISSLTWCSDLSCTFQISRSDYVPVKALTEKRGDMIRITGRYGLYWKIKSFVVRPVLLLGLCTMVSLILFLPSRILFVRVSGNRTVSDRYILEAAEESGVYFGVSRRGIRSEKVKNAILSRIPQLQWVGVNTAGCVATISVRERSVQDNPEEMYPVSSIVAAKDGFILSSSVISGNPLFQIGQAVKEGQVLVSGYTDCGICIRAGRSSAEIYAQTQRNLDVATPVTFREIENPGRARYTISLLIRKKRINLWKDSGISPSTCGRIYKEYYLTLPGGFQLPFAVCLEEFTPWEARQVSLPDDQAEKLLAQCAQHYLSGQMVAGEILDEDYRIEQEKGIHHLYGKYTCAEMIGREQPEQIGEWNGKNN